MADISTLEEEKKVLDEVWRKYGVKIRENRIKRRVKKKRRDGAKCNLIRVIEGGYGRPQWEGDDRGV